MVLSLSTAYFTTPFTKGISHFGRLSWGLSLEIRSFTATCLVGECKKLPNMRKFRHKVTTNNWEILFWQLTHRLPIHKFKGLPRNYVGDVWGN